MNRAGSDEENSNAWLMERNLHQRAVLLSLFAALLLLIDLYPFFQRVDSPAPVLVSSTPAGENASWLLQLAPQDSAAAMDGAFSLVNSPAQGAALANDCSVPPELAPFFALAMDINRARIKDLTLLAGIGPALGQRIVAEREKNGPFESPQALLRVAGIGPKTLAGLAPHICTR